MRNILFVSDVFTNGGLETRITEQAKYYKKHDVTPFLICDEFRAGQHEATFAKIVSGVKLAPQNGYLAAEDILKASRTISKFCKEQRIDFIECQPFWCLLPALLAADHAKIPLSYTLHGTASGNFIDAGHPEARLLFYLSLLLAPDQIVATSKRLASVYYYISPSITISPNGISNFKPLSKKSSKTGLFAIASRLAPPKTEPILNFLPRLCALPATKRIDIYGDGEDFRAVQELITSSHLESKVRLLGWTNDLTKQLTATDYDCVFGLGRVITDAISLGLPAGVLGYGGFAGFVTQENITNFANNNFISWKKGPDGFLSKSLTELYRHPNRFVFTKEQLSFLDSDQIWANHLESQPKATTPKAFPSELLNLLKTYPAENILAGSALLPSLYQILSMQNPDTLVYNDTLSLLSRQIMDQAEVIAGLKAQLSDMENSLSWKTTKPLRKASGLVQKLTRR